VTDFYTPGSLAETTLSRFCVFTDEEPDLIRTGFRPMDEAIGGMSPGTCGLLIAERGLGKSSLTLTAAYASPDKVGILSLEDAVDVVGSRLLALKTGINSLSIRLKRLNADEKRRLREAQEALELEDGVAFSFRIAGSLGACLDGIDELAAAGCRLVFVDYVTKIRGISDSRKDEVATAYTTLQERIAKHGMAGVVLSQITDSLTPTKKPCLTQVRDSRDLLNECRIGLVAWREEDDPNLIHVSLDKSTVGSEYLRFSYRRDASGTLREVDDFHDPGSEF
jgi:replicative DNA helicase